jgi:sulfur-oxidizing protein SoxY
LRVIAEWPAPLFEQTSAESLLRALLGDARPAPAGEVRLNTPDIAENGATVQVGVETTLAGVESISLVIPKNPRPLIAMFEVDRHFAGYVETRVKMAESSEVIALVQTPEGPFTGTARVKVTKGGCGG